MSKQKPFLRILAALLAVCVFVALPGANVSASEQADSSLAFFIDYIVPIISQLQKILSAMGLSTNLSLPRVGISAGHGGNTGAYSGGVYEDVKTLAIALAVNKEFTSRGYETLMNRTDNSKCDKETKLALYQPWRPDILLEFHYNIGGGTAEGLEVWYDSGNAEGKRLAELLAPRLSAAAGLKNRGAKGDDYAPGGNFYVCSSFPIGILVECAFLDNPNDVKKLDSTASKEKFAKAVAEVAAEFWGG
ncbi:MAG: N-acetylmuramoyl-L-alanine amidase [Oscillospiraceae bacterium]|jgi:N-acetylmuramoyl-L-alanine amidase|nr:N-acetylmuramoyl-L-alanine amidase [Oscillospiraceae bacterium]